jgi:hypothetical protein
MAAKYILVASFWLSTVSGTKGSHDGCPCHCEPIQTTFFVETESEEDEARKLVSKRNIIRRSTFEGFRIRSTFHRADHRAEVYGCTLVHDAYRQAVSARRPRPITRMLIK